MTITVTRVPASHISPPLPVTAPIPAAITSPAVPLTPFPTLTGTVRAPVVLPQITPHLAAVYGTGGNAPHSSAATIPIAAAITLGVVLLVAAVAAVRRRRARRA